MTRVRSMAMGLAACVVLNASTLPAQSPANAAFEVASIKVNKSKDTVKGVQSNPGGQFSVTNLTLRELIGTAYEIPPPLRKTRMSGGPNWMDADRFDIVAKAEANSRLSQHLGMLRTLLADRFKLVATTATRDLPVYALVVARSDRQLGPQLQKVPDVDCAALRAASRGLPSPPPRSPSVVGACGFRVENSGMIMSGGTTMADFVRIAFPRMIRDRVVVDRTGLIGSYSVKIEWTPEAEPFAEAAALPPGLPAPPPPANAGTSIFTALQEQLGLKLEPARAPVQTLVIERAERPTED